MASMPTHVPLLMPELDLSPRQAVTVSCWLIPLGREVCEGDRLLELSAGEVLVDLSAPATGMLAQRAVSEGEVVRANQVLGVIQAES
jgi:pyruvate/2-oxoglutarate dehydrogenase complex dihydrolipoamide acyltransferase (E2) component